MPGGIDAAATIERMHDRVRQDASDRIEARFARSFWTYRDHPKNYRAILFETGHAPQNLHLAATEPGLGARLQQRATVELHPRNTVWDEDGRLR